MTLILIIEDEATLRNEVVEWMMLEGYEAIGTSHGVQGVEEAFRAPPDLIICDVRMPYLDGYGVLSQIRANASTADVPFIFVTANSTEADVQHGMKLGADDYVIKPFTRLELLDAIQACLEKTPRHS